MTKKALYVAKDYKDRKLQQALLQPHKPEHREILRDYRSKKRRDDVAAGAKRDYGTCDSRKPAALQNSSRRKRSLVEPPTEKLGKKLYLDSR